MLWCLLLGGHEETKEGGVCSGGKSVCGGGGDPTRGGFNAGARVGLVPHMEQNSSR